MRCDDRCMRGRQETHLGTEVPATTLWVMRNVAVCVYCRFRVTVFVGVGN
jgi:hypothetical protein